MSGISGTARSGAAKRASATARRRTPGKIASLLKDAGEPAQDRNVSGTVPLTEAQRGVYFECVERPGSTAYNIPFALRLPGSVDTERFALAVERAAKNHPALFAGIDTEDGEPVMRADRYSFRLTRSTAESAAEAGKDFVRPFAPGEEPLCRFELCAAPDGTVFLFDVHHLVFDGSSLRVLLSEIADAYAGKEISAEILGHKEFDLSEDLFEAGLTSIGTLKMNLKLSKAFSVPVRLSDIKEHPTVEELARFFGGAVAESVYAPREEYPLMQNQMGVFLDAGADSGSLRYNIPLLLKLSDSIDTERLKAAVCRAIDAHPYLKATLKNDENGEIRAVRNDGAAPEIERIVLPSLPEKEELLHPFSLLGGSLYRAAIYETETGNYLFFDVHHIVADGTSLAIFLNDVGVAYADGEPEKESFTGFEAALEEERTASSGSYAAAEKYYETLLSGANTDCLPGKCPEKKPDIKTPRLIQFNYSSADFAA